jgi:hypothetical protein
MATNSYIVFSFRGRDFLSVPARPSRLKAVGVRLYKESSARRRLFKTVIRLGVFACVDKWVGREHLTPVPKHPTFNFEAWLDQVRQDLRIPDAQAVVTFPGQPRRARFYVNLVSPEGDPLGFAKISLDSKNDRHLLTENEVLSALADQFNLSFRLPTVLVAGQFNSHQYLITEAMPVGARPIEAKWEPTPRRCHDELVRESHQIKPIRRLSWWNSFSALRDQVEPLAEAVDRWADQEIDVCWAHGDFTHRNICEAGNSVWIFDWENSSPDAPVMTDEVRFFWAMQSRRITAGLARVAFALSRNFLTGADERRRRDLALALAFLCTCTQGGIVCGRNWNQMTQRR